MYVLIDNQRDLIPFESKPILFFCSL